MWTGFQPILYQDSHRFYLYAGRKLKTENNKCAYNHLLIRLERTIDGSAARVANLLMRFEAVRLPPADLLRPSERQLINALIPDG